MNIGQRNTILKTAASTLVEIRDKGFNSMEELERGIRRISIEKKI